jgi:uncharacterized RDD family membrane protein YckC
LKPASDLAPRFAVRLGAMLFEALLLFALCFGTGFLLLTAMRWAYPLSDSRRWVLQCTLFVVLGIYFVYCWTGSGQTLAMRSWRLKVVDRNGGLITLRIALLRYLTGWSLVLPGLLLAAALGAGPWVSLALIGLGAVAMLLVTLIDPERQALHDRLLGTRLIRASAN